MVCLTLNAAKPQLHWPSTFIFEIRQVSVQKAIYIFFISSFLGRLLSSSSNVQCIVQLLFQPHSFISRKIYLICCNLYHISYINLKFSTSIDLSNLNSSFPTSLIPSKLNENFLIWSINFQLQPERSNFRPNFPTLDRTFQLETERSNFGPNFPT